jgi:exodeoxyribonuclease V alpha subunit
MILSYVKNGDIDFSQDVILCCRNGDSAEEPLTVKSLNADIKKIVNAEFNGSPTTISQGDRIICTVNSSELDVWNGTTGRCACFDVGRSMWVELDFPNSDGERNVLIPKDKVKDWQLAYALTVHKSQGSQYCRVIFAVARRDVSNLLNRPMVYTAVTRAKRSCRIIGDAWAFGVAVRELQAKHTVIQEISSEEQEPTK